MVFGNGSKTCNRNRDNDHFSNHTEAVMYVQDQLRKSGRVVLIAENIGEHKVELYKTCDSNILYDVRSSNDNLLLSAKIKFKVIPIHYDPNPFYRVFLDAFCCHLTNVTLESTFYLENEDNS